MIRPQLENSDLVLESCTTENTEISSASSLITDINPSGRSLIYTEKAMILAWGRPALMWHQVEDCPLRTILRNVSLQNEVLFEVNK